MLNATLPPESADDPLDVLSDELLRGDRPDDDFDAFYLRIFRRLVSRAIVLGCPRGDAETVAQDVMIKIWDQWDTITWSTRSRYAMVAIRNQVITRYRREQGRHRGQSRLESEREIRSRAEGDDVETVTVDRLEAASALRFILQDLSDREREVFLLKYDGLNCVEIADALGIAATSVRTHLHHARTKLKTHLAGRSK